MNRIIKFRVWNRQDKNWENPAILEVFNQDGILRPLYDPVENYIIQQFTGLQDNHGKDIYEGDILKCKGYDSWFDKEGHFYNIEVKFQSIETGDAHNNGHLYIPKNREIIGNIFENPELLK